MFWRTGQTIIFPGFGMMDREFTFHVSKVNHITRRIYWNAGLLTPRSRRGVPMSDFRWDTHGQRWVYKILPLDVEG